jgi:hypothetical protein
MHVLLAALLARAPPAPYAVHVTSMCGTDVNQTYQLQDGGKDGTTSSKPFGITMDRVTGPPIARYFYKSFLQVEQSGDHVNFLVTCNNIYGVTRLDGKAGPGQGLTVPEMIVATVSR